MTDDEKDKCHLIIHSAAVAAAAIGAIPIPGADLLPISGVQATMIIALARVFEYPITQNIAKEMAKTFFIGQAGKALVASFSKLIPFIGSGINATVAAGLTETLGWETAKSFSEKVKVA